MKQPIATTLVTFLSIWLPCNVWATENCRVESRKTSCIASESQPNQLTVEDANVHGLTSEQAEMLDKIPHINIQPENIIIDGMSLSDALAKHPEWFDGMNHDKIQQ